MYIYIIECMTTLVKEKGVWMAKRIGGQDN